MTHIQIIMRVTQIQHASKRDGGGGGGGGGGGEREKTKETKIKRKTRIRWARGEMSERKRGKEDVKE
jgi:hypothetical protein